MTYNKPPVDLLQRPMKESEITDRYILSVREGVAEVLSDFKTDAQVVAHRVSPLNVIVELKLGQEVQFRNIQDLSRNFEIKLARPVKVFRNDEASRSVYIAVAHGSEEVTYLREVLEDKTYQSSTVIATIAAGVDERGNRIIMTLDDSAPHLMIAGTTGSGKTVFLDDIIMSILYKAGPRHVRLLLIDPERVDLSVYNGLPQLLCPVLSNKGEITLALEKVCAEIDSRHAKLAAAGDGSSRVRIDEYNDKNPDKMYELIVVIDKYLSLTEEMPADFETHVTRIATQGRDVNVRLILNTQTPRSEVVSGFIKNNIARTVAFSLTTSGESRAAIDRTGAEKLNEPGEMLITTAGGGAPLHGKACYVSLKEIKAVVDDIKAHNPAGGASPYDPAFADVHKDYAIVEDRGLMLDLLKYLSKNTRTNVNMIQKHFDVPLPQAYEMIDVLQENDYIDTFLKGFHVINTDTVNAALKELGA